MVCRTVAVNQCRGFSSASKLDDARNYRLYRLLGNDVHSSSTITPRRRAGKHPKTRLEGYSGYLQADAYACYGQVFADDTIVEVACWAHARRKFFEISRQAEKGKRISAHEALDFIGQLYDIEREAKEQQLDAEGICRLRQEKARPILAQFKDWLEGRVRELAPSYRPPRPSAMK